MEEVVPIVHRVADGRIDLQAMRLTDLSPAGVQTLPDESEYVLGVNEEDGAATWSMGPGAALANSGERSSCSRLRRRLERSQRGWFTFAIAPERTSKRVADQATSFEST